MKKLKISKIWIALLVVVIVAVAAWALSGGKKGRKSTSRRKPWACKPCRTA